jgi:radical SAM superfamily enzyme YgiQ (UPF0313 family)
LIDLMAEDDRQTIKEAISSFRPDVIGISVRNIDDQNMERPRFLLDKVRRVVDDCRGVLDVPIILGGAGYSIFPESALNYLGADMGIQGEGEEAFLILLDRLHRGASLHGTPSLYLRGRGLQARRKFVMNLDDVPSPDIPFPRGSASGEEIWMPVQTSRGCPMNCSYCSTPAIEGRSRYPTLSFCRQCLQSSAVTRQRTLQRAHRQGPENILEVHFVSRKGR